MVIYSSILAWKIPCTEEPGGLQSMGLQESDTTEWLNHHHPCTEEENGRGPSTEPQESLGSKVHLLTILWKFLSVLLQSSLLL